MMWLHFICYFFRYSWIRPYAYDCSKESSSPPSSFETLGLLSITSSSSLKRYIFSLDRISFVFMGLSLSRKDFIFLPLLSYYSRSFSLICALSNSMYNP